LGEEAITFKFEPADAIEKSYHNFTSKL
jgi:hypothetical protein